MGDSRIASMDEMEDRHRRVLAFCLKRRRDQAGWTQRELAARSGLSLSEIQHIEHDRRDPRNRTLKRLCAAFGISRMELLAEVERVEREWELAGR